MKRLMRRLEDIFAAVAFAEEGEHETAREMLKESKSSTPETMTEAPVVYTFDFEQAIPEED